MVEGAAGRLGEHGFVIDVEEFATRQSADAWLAAYAALSAVAAAPIYPAPLVATVLASRRSCCTHATPTAGRRWSARLGHRIDGAPAPVPQ